MKKISAVIICLSLVFLLSNPAHARKSYKTYEVIEVTEYTLVLQRKNGETIEINRAKRTNLEKGDRIRYDKNRNRMGKTLDKE